MGRTGIGLLWMCLCCAFPAFLNVANVTGKTYSQSSYWNAASHPASFAANGKTSGDFNSPNCIHTAHTNDHTPWWQVDLGRKYPVYDITLWARSYYLRRLYPLNITVDGQLCVRAYSNNERNQSLTCTSAIYGQVVRLTRDYRASGNNITLNLCEVQIWICPDDKYGNQCNNLCSSISRCSGQCYRNGCTACSGHFKPPQCTGCDAGYYKSGSSCVQCSSTCVSRRCNAESGRCDNCASGSYKSGTTCVTCNSNCVNGACRSEDGRCTSGCVSDRQWGNQCEKSCSSHCATYPCNRNTGNCNGCIVGWYGDRCDSRCSTKTPGCSQCAQDRVQCTACKDRYYISGTTCVLCSSNCLNRQCDPDTGVCDSCIAGLYGDRCDSRCSTKTPGCSQCAQDGGPCTACKDRYYISGTTCVPCSSNCLNRQCDPDTGVCDRPLEKVKESLVWPVVGAVVGVGLIAVIVTAVLCWRRKFHRSSGKATTVEMSSAAPANKLSDAANTGPDPPPPSSSPANATDGIYEIPEDNKDRNNGPTRQAAPPTSSSSAEPESRDYENEIQGNNYDKLCVYSNDEGDRALYTELADVTADT